MDNELSKNQVNGELVMRTIAMPSDTNANGDIFGGWLLSQMDLGGAIIAKSYSTSGRAVTVSIDSMSFINPVKVGDLVSCYAKLLSHGRTSMKVQIDAWTYSYTSHKLCHVTKGVFTYVAIDANGKPCPIIEKPVVSL
jgi:acyl-CoA thioesterase YciA